MNVLVLGGTRYFGVHMVKTLIKNGHDVTIATRGCTADDFGNQVHRIIVDRTNGESMVQAFKGKVFDVVCDNIAYCSNDVKIALDAIHCNRYIMTSTLSVYYDLHINLMEKDFDPLKTQFKWCNREDYKYETIKQYAECALFQTYSTQNGVAVRFPFVIGKDDYTKRLYFYVEHVVKEIPMFIDNVDAQMGFVSSNEAGEFLAFLAEQQYTGIVNGSNSGTISLKEIIEYVEERTGKHAIISKDGEVAPYNGATDYNLNIDIASELGFEFSPVKSYIYDLLNGYIETANID